MTRRYKVKITRDPGWFVARCLEPDVVSQGRTCGEARANLREAVELYIESFGEVDSLIIPPGTTTQTK